MEGRFGPMSATARPTLPKSADPKAVTLDEAVALIDAKAAKGPSKGNGRRRLGRRSSAAGFAGWIRSNADLRQLELRPSNRCNVPAASGRCRRYSDGQQRRETADRAGQRAEHAQFGAGVAIVGVERIADEAAIAGRPRNRATWPWNCWAAAEISGMPSRTAASLTVRRVAKLSVPSMIRSWPDRIASTLSLSIRSATVRHSTCGLRLPMKRAARSTLRSPT